MAKVQIKSEKNTSFGGIFHVREFFSPYSMTISLKSVDADIVGDEAHLTGGVMESRGQVFDSPRKRSTTCPSD